MSDWSSDVCSSYLAGAQKNIGPSGVTIVIVRDDLIGQTLERTPGIFDYKQMADSASMLNTPPCLAWYVSGLRSEERREGQSVSVRVDLGGRSIINKKKITI